MLLTVDMTQPLAVRVGATGLPGLAQEIRTVLATRKGSVPLDRDFGLSWDVVDMPMPKALPYLVSEVGQALERHVPRIRVRDVSFANSPADTGDGVLRPIVTVEIREEYLDDFR
jgi:phage baseplate assembly protein W